MGECRSLQWLAWGDEVTDLWMVEVLPEGYHIPFRSALTSSGESISYPALFCLNSIRGKTLVQEVAAWFREGSIGLSPLPSPRYYSRLFLVLKPRGCAGL